MEFEESGQVVIDLTNSRTGPLKPPKPTILVPKRRKTHHGLQVPKPTLPFPGRRKPYNKSVASQKGTLILKKVKKQQVDDPADTSNSSKGIHGRTSAIRERERSFRSHEREVSSKNSPCTTPPSVAAILKDAAAILANEDALRPLLFKIPTESPEMDNSSDFDKWYYEVSPPRKTPAIVVLPTFPAM